MRGFGGWLGTMLSFTLPLAIGVGVGLAGLGIAVYPPVATWPAPLICAGAVEIRSERYAVAGGTSGISRHVECVAGVGKAAAREEITFAAFGIAAAVYVLPAIVLLQLFAAPRFRRLIDRAPGLRGIAGMEGAVPERGPRSPAELQAVLGEVSDALLRRAAERGARPIVPGAAAADPAEHLARLKRLREAGLIDAAEREPMICARSRAGREKRKR